MPPRAEGKPHLRACSPSPGQVMSVAFQRGSANTPCPWRSRYGRLGSQPLAAGPQFLLSSPGLGSGEAAVVADAFLVTCAHSVTLQMAPLPSPRSVPLQVPHPALLTVLPHPRLSSHPASSPLSLEFTKPMAPPPHVALWCLRPNSLTHFAGQSLSPSGLASKTTLCQGTLMVSAK